MPDIVHEFPIKAAAESVFQAITSPTGLDAWWTKRSSGKPDEGTEYKLWFGLEYDWRAVVSRCAPKKEFELHITSADRDWQNTRVGFSMDEKNGVTRVRFHHLSPTNIIRVSCFCWAMYLRLLKRYVELGEVVSYEDRLDV